MNVDEESPGGTSRRRYRGAAAAAAVGVAAVIVIPLGLLGNDEGPPGGGAPAQGQQLLEGLARGPEPAAGYLVGSTFRRDGSNIDLHTEPGSNVVDLAVLSDGFLYRTLSQNGDSKVHAAAGDGTTITAWPAEPNANLPMFVVSRDRHLGAFIGPGLRTIVVEDGGRTVTTLPRPHAEVDMPFGAADLHGRTCSGPEADCAVLAHGLVHNGRDGLQPLSTWKLRPGQASVDVDTPWHELTAVAANGHTGGTVKITDDGDGGCDGVADERGKVLWQSCQHRVISFSPDSRLVLAGPPTSDAPGGDELTVLDARTGKQRLIFRTAGDVGIGDTAWEDADHLLAVVTTWRVHRRTDQRVDRRWGVVRLGTDGSRELAVAPVKGKDEDFDGPLDLPQSS